MNTSEDKHGGILLGEAVKAAYSRGQTDYSMEPLVRLDPNGQPVGKVQTVTQSFFAAVGANGKLS